MDNQRWLLHRTLWAIGAAIAGVGLGTSIASAASLVQDAAGDTQQIWAVLMPLATASIGVERGVEVVWNYIEWALLNSKRWEIANLKSAQYIQFKSGTSLMMGILAGILLSNYTGMQLFRYLEPVVPTFVGNVPALWDIVITGIIIGAGAKPAHDILGIITQIKNFLGNSAIHQREAAAQALADGVLKLSQSEAQTMVDVPGIGPARLPAAQGAPRGMAGDEEDATDASEVSDVQRHIETLRRQTAY